MTTLGGNVLTIHDIVRRQKPDGTLAMIAEMQDQENGMVGDIPWVQGDLPNGSFTTSRVALPSWGTLNPNGTATLSKSVTSQNLENIMALVGWSEVADTVARYGGDAVAQRRAEAKSFFEGGKQSVAAKILSANSLTTAGEIDGLQTRYASSTATNGRNVILAGAAGGQTDCMSIYRIEWGEGKCYGLYPKGSQAGLETIDHGLQVVEVSSTTRKSVWAEEFRWSFGLAVVDWRSVARICNIDKSLLVAGTGADLADRLIQSAYCMPTNSSGKGQAIYMNITTRMMFDIQSRNDVQAGGGITYGNVNGQMMENFRGVPINREDQLTEAESVVT
jgi:hypothetical protein